LKNYDLDEIRRFLPNNNQQFLIEASLKFTLFMRRSDKHFYSEAGRMVVSQKFGDRPQVFIQL
jgi:hypothetical protein